MGRSAKPVDPDISRWEAMLDRLLSSAFVLWRNPAIVGTSVAAAVTFAFVSANAMWNQPHAHRSAFFATRAPLDADRPGETVIRIERRAVEIDPAVQHVQSVLREMGLYVGTADGVAGPRTRSAVAQYRKIVGLPASEAIDGALIERLGGLPDGVAVKPRKVEAIRSAAQQPKPLTVEEAIADVPDRAIFEAAEFERPVQTASIEPLVAPEPDLEIMKLQAGLKAFGNEAIEVDGVIGQRTRAAIREFQALFGLTETGEPNDQLFAKLREVGLTN